MNDQIKIYVLSGKRGGFGALRPFLKQIHNSHNTKLILALTDQHLNSNFGNTVEEVKEDFEELELLPLGEYGSLQEDRSIAMSILQKSLTESLTKHRPDYVVIYGDRAESLIGAFVANLLSIKVIHFQGGDKSGSVDEHFRHAITKLSHLHLVSCDDSKNRILQMGEDPKNIRVIGDSHIDEIASGNICDDNVMRQKLNLPNNARIITLLQHSETTQVKYSSKQIKETIKALEKFVKEYKNFKIIAIYPCSDPGFNEIVDELKSSKVIYSLYKNLNADLFRSLLRSSEIFIGNSSAGIIESPYLNTPSINIGRRQTHRLSTSMTINVKHDHREIYAALIRIMKEDFYLQDPLYGDGFSYLKAYETIIKREREIKFAKNFFDY